MASDRLGFGTHVYRFFLSKGLTPPQAAAIAGNMAWEGGGRTDLVNPGDNYRNSPRAPHSVGIAQWNDRSKALFDFARAQGIDIPEGDLRDVNYAREAIRRVPLDTQLEFAWQEMQGPERRAYGNITRAQTLQDATAGAIGYHRPAGWTWANPRAGHGFSGRMNLANQILAASGQEPSATPQFSTDPTAAPTERAPVQVAAATPRAEPTSLGGSDGNPLSTIIGAIVPGAVNQQGQLDPQEVLKQTVQNLEQAKTAQAYSQQAAPEAQNILPQRPQQPLDLSRIRQMMARRIALGTGEA